MKKKVLASLTIIVFMLSILLAPVYAGGLIVLNLTPDRTVVAPGDTVKLTISYPNITSEGGVKVVIVGLYRKSVV